MKAVKIAGLSCGLMLLGVALVVVLFVIIVGILMVLGA